VSGPDSNDAFGEALWREFAQRVEGLAELLTAEGAPRGPSDRAAGVRYLARFLAAGLRVCLECDDADYPSFGRMIENGMSWGLDNPDCNYSWARIRGDGAGALRDPPRCAAPARQLARARPRGQPRARSPVLR
jgi:hypothetical protein